MKRDISSVAFLALTALLVCPSLLGLGCQSRNAPQSPAAHEKNVRGFPDDTTISVDAKNGTIRSLKAKNLSAGLESDESFREFQKKGKYDKIACTYISVHKEQFKFNNPSEELVTAGLQTDNLGYKHLKFQQVYKNLTVLDCEVIVHLNQSNQIYLIEAHTIPTPAELDVHPTLDKDTASRLAIESVHTSGPLETAAETIPAIFVSENGNALLAYRTYIKNRFPGWMVIVDAHTGEILKKISTLISN